MSYILKQMNPDIGTSIRYKHKNTTNPQNSLGNILAYINMCVCKNWDLQLPHFSTNRKKSRIV